MSGAAAAGLDSALGGGSGCGLGDSGCRSCGGAGFGGALFGLALGLAGLGGLAGRTLLVVAGLALGEAFALVLALGVVFDFVERIERVLERLVGVGVVDLVLDDVVHLVLRAAELGDGPADGFRNRGQLIGPENEEAEQQDER
jgi:hypothetical protein